MDDRPVHQHKVFDMSALGWITTGRRMLLEPFLRRRSPRLRKLSRRTLAPTIESLETIDLMSRAGLPIAPAQVLAFSSNSAATTVRPLVTSQASATQTVTVGSTLTNFTQPFVPPIDLFNPSLGTLVSVHVTASATLTSQIRSANTSTTSPADITGFTNGGFQITGLDQGVSGILNSTTGPFPVTVQIYPGGPFVFTNVTTPVSAPTSVPGNGVIFSPLVTSSTQSYDVTSPAGLAFYTQTTGRTTIIPNLVATAVSGARAPNGNLQTNVTTAGSGVVTVTYTFLPQLPAVTKIVRFGIHHQPTQLQLTFAGPLNPTDASNPAFYKVLQPNKHGSFTGPGVKTIRVVSAVYDPNTFTVTLTTATQLNVHQLFQLVISLPGTNGKPVVIEFGSTSSLGGFFFHGQHFIRGANGKFVLG
jgi:hypothetical protein